MNRLLTYIFLCVAAVMSAVETMPRVSVLTVAPGDDIYQLEGHTALRIIYPPDSLGRGSDVAVNWGVFDFNTPNFVYRFCKGETIYSIGLSTTDEMLYWYGYAGRGVTEQVLDLDSIQTEAILRAISINFLPENQKYRYNYVKDNCATRPLALIDHALAADSSSLAVNMPQEETSFRSEMRRYHKNHPTYQMGIDLALGSGIDYTITPREQAFAPVYLERLLASAEVIGPDGSRRPLVAETQSLLPVVGPEPVETLPSPWLWTSIILALAIGFSIRDLIKKKTTRWFDFLFYLLYGIGGVIIAFLVFISTHEATSPNLNLLWLNPLLLLIPSLIWIKSCKKIVFWIQIVNFALLLAFAAIMPFAQQSFNWLFLPLILADMARSATYHIIHRHDP